MGIKDFNAARAAEPVDGQVAPIVFELGYAPVDPADPDAPRKPLEWSVPRDLAPWALLNLAATATDEGSSEGDQMVAFVSFLKGAFASPADFAPFGQMLARERISVEVIAAVTAYIVEEATGRPFEASSTSALSPSGGGVPSRDDSPSPGLRQVG